MKKNDSSAIMTSVWSLLAITAGAVSAALVIMFVGLFLTMVSLASSSVESLRASAPGVDVDMTRPEATLKVAQRTLVAGQAQSKPRKGRYMDALLREEVSSGSHGSVAGEAPALHAPDRLILISNLGQWRHSQPHTIKL